MNDLKNQVAILKNEYIELKKMLEANMQIDNKTIKEENISSIENTIEEMLNNL